MKGNSRKTTQVTVCCICGDKGFSNALIDCSKCPDTFAHQYCMGIPPGSIDSSFTWVCEDCCEPSQHQPNISMMPGDNSAKSSEEACDVSTHMNDTKRKMKAITSLYSESHTHKEKGNKHKRKRDALNPNAESLPTLRSRYRVKKLRGPSLSTSKYDRGEDIAINKPAKVTNVTVGAKYKSGSSRKVRGRRNHNVKIRNEEKGRPKCVTNGESLTDPVGAKYKSGSSRKVRGHRNENAKIRNEEKGQHKYVTNGESLSDPDNWKLVLLEEQPEPLLILMPIEYEGSSEQAATTSYGSDPKFMDCPKEIMRGVVLLVTPLGEIYIECASFTDDPYPTCLETALLRLTNGYCGISSNDLVLNECEQTSVNCGIEETEVEHCG